MVYCLSTGELRTDEGMPIEARDAIVVAPLCRALFGWSGDMNLSGEGRRDLEIGRWYVSPRIPPADSPFGGLWAFPLLRPGCHGRVFLLIDGDEAGEYIAAHREDLEVIP